MIYLGYFFVGVFFTNFICLFWYLVRPKGFYITVNNQDADRTIIFLHHFLVAIILFIVFAFTLDKNPPEYTREIGSLLFFLGGICLIVLCIFKRKNKININLKWKVKDNKKPIQPNKDALERKKFKWVDKEKNRLILEDAKKDWQKFKSDFSNIKEQTKNDWNQLKENRVNAKTQNLTEESYSGVVETSSISGVCDFEIDYEDFNGNFTYNRRVLLIEVYESNDCLYLKAFCDKSGGEERTFRVDRIHKVFDIEACRFYYNQDEIEKLFKKFDSTGYGG